MAEVRASDADRDRVAVVLRDHYGAGRLTDEELSARLDAAYAARHTGELSRLTADLPEKGHAVSPTPRRHITRGGRALRAGFRMHAIMFAVVNLFLIAIWAVAGGGYFWPVWPLLGWGVGLAAHGAPILAGAGTRPYDPALAERVEPKELERAAAPDGTVTILFTDIEGSTALNERLGDVRYMELLRRHHSIIRERLSAFGGHEVKQLGDGFMLAFPSARRALDCALAIQAALRELPDVRVRIGLHTGEAIRDDTDFYGRNVVLASRITAQARGGETLASEIVRQLTESAGDIAFGDAREVELEGLEGRHRVYPVT